MGEAVLQLAIQYVIMVPTIIILLYRRRCRKVGTIESQLGDLGLWYNQQQKG